MANLEHTASWADVVRFADSLSLKQLAERLNTTPGAVSAALRRSGAARSLGLAVDDDLPPEAGARPVRGDEDDDDDDDLVDDDDDEDLDDGEFDEEPLTVLPQVAAALRRIRAGSKDMLIARHATGLGQLPDAEVARRAGVSVRTVASFRARHGIPGYRGPRRAARTRAPRRSRIDPFLDLLGTVPDRVVADRAGVSLNAVRNYRVKRGIVAAGRERARGDVEVPAGGPTGQVVPGAHPAPAAPRVDPPSSERIAWRITWQTSAGPRHGVLIARDLVDAARQAQRARVDGEVVGIELAGVMIDG